MISRVWAISVDNKSIGSSYAYGENGIIYLITAAHVLGSVPHGEKRHLSIFHDGNWERIEGIAYYVVRRPYHEGDIDIAIIKTNIPCGDETDFQAPISSGDVILGHDVYFLGFPYFGSKIMYSSEPNNQKFPIPFIKKAIISAMIDNCIYIDGHNNPGFSGGPIVYWDHSLNKHRVLGVISAYITQEGKVHRIETSTNDFYRENSGIGVAYGIKFAKDLISEH